MGRAVVQNCNESLVQQTKLQLFREEITPEFRFRRKSLPYAACPAATPEAHAH
jgi:hypothetical protein